MMWFRFLATFFIHVCIALYLFVLLFLLDQVGVIFLLLNIYKEVKVLSPYFGIVNIKYQKDSFLSVSPAKNDSPFHGEISRNPLINHECNILKLYRVYTKKSKRTPFSRPNFIGPPTFAGVHGVHLNNDCYHSRIRPIWWLLM